MASVFCNKSGQWVVQWQVNKVPKTIYLGAVDEAFASEFRRRVEKLIEAKDRDRPVDQATRRWQDSLPARLASKLVERGLAESTAIATLDELCLYCIAQADVKSSSLQKYRDTHANLITFFPANTDLQAITPGAADEFRRWLAKSGCRRKVKEKVAGPLSASTVSKRIEQARQFFKTAVRKRWIHDNPFADVKAPATQPKDREHFISRDDIQKLLDAADHELRLIIALARYGGLRVPSEIWPLRLDWINRETETLMVYSPKNERHEHKKWRHVPLFPKLRPILLDAFDRAEPGSVSIVPNRGITATAVRNSLDRLCLKCGILPWPKPWQNMRSSRETELLDAGFPIHTVCAWLNNSPAVALRHYAQITKDHIRRAVVGEGYYESLRTAQPAAENH
jgi:site-specific recombinase XerD